MSKGHPHAALMAQFAEDAKTHEEPWKLWEVMELGSKEWATCSRGPSWIKEKSFRRKPTPLFVNLYRLGNTGRYYFGDILEDKLYLENSGLLNDRYVKTIEITHLL